MRRFIFHRTEDMTGVSGTGVVAEGVEFSDGRVALMWQPLDDDHISSIAIWTSMEHMMRVHGHHQLTSVEFLDDLAS